MSKTGLNAGVHASSGFEMQKHCALYIILEKFNQFKIKEYFVSVEHADDVIFCFIHDDEIEYIDAYQVKKNSVIWTNNQVWREIVQELLTTGKELTSKDIIKSADYYHKLSFLSNQTSRISKKIKDKITGDTKEISVLVNEAKTCVKFDDFPEILKNDIIKQLKITDTEIIDEFKNLFFEFIDLSRSIKAQRECLIGKCSKVFGKSVPDPEAAIDTIMKVFRKVEHTFNQGDSFDLLDESKRIYSIEINAAFKVITEKAIAFETWRHLKRDLSSKLRIPIARVDDFENEFDNGIDCFKDLTQVEHQRILKFVQKNKEILSEHYLEEDCIVELYNKYISGNSCKLDDLVIKATIFAAYVQVRDNI